MLTAFKQADREREALLEFIEAEQEYSHPDEPASFMLLRYSNDHPFHLGMSELRSNYQELC
jgi:hypothetical protein